MCSSDLGIKSVNLVLRTATGESRLPMNNQGAYPSIRYIDIRTGTMEVLVGNGQKGDGPDGDDPLNCRLNRPHGVFVDKDGSILIGDSESHSVRIWRR